MTILTFALGALLFLAGGYSLYLSVNLVPTEMGLVYGLSGVIFLSASFGVWAIAALIAQLDRIFAAPRETKTAVPTTAAPREDAPSEPVAETSAPAPAAEPEVVARYNAAGGKYVLFSTGEIEAETPEGAMRFGSMEEFKAFVASRRR